MFYRNNAIAFRLLLLFLLMILPVFLMGLYFYNQGIALQDSMLAQTMGQHLTWEMQTLSSQVQAVQNTLIYLSEEEELNAFSSRPDIFSAYERAHMLKKLQSRLYSISISHEALDQLTLWLPQVGKRLSAKSPNINYPTIADIDDATLSHLLAQAKHSNGQTILTGEGMYYLYQLPLAGVLRESSTPRILFRADFTLELILRRLTDSLSSYSLGYVVLNGENALMATNETNDAFIDEVLSLAQDPTFFRVSPLDGPAFDNLTENAARILSIGGKRCYVLPVSVRVPRMNVVFYILRDTATADFVEYRLWVWGLTAMLALALILYSWYAYARVQTPVTLLLHGYKQLERGNMDFSIQYGHRDEFHRLVQQFNRTLLRLKDLLAQLYDQRLLTQQAEMKQLQAQINPHFLYNNFYILDSMIALGDYDNASVYLQNLGNYFKYVTRSDTTEAYLSQELEHARTYLAIQAMRFGQSLEIDFPPLPEGLSNPRVPKIILQPIVENVFKHAFEHSDGAKRLSIVVTETSETLEISIENSGETITEQAIDSMRAALDLPADQRASTGLSNVHKRLLISHGEGLTLAARPGGGLRVSFRLRQEGED